MRIAFVDGPWPGNGHRTQRWPHKNPMGHINPPPIFMMYAAAVCRQRKHTVKLWDSPAQRLNYNVLLDEIENFAPDVNVINTTTPSFDHDLNLARELRRKVPRALNVMVGPHATFFYDQILETTPEVDIIALGEFDLTIGSLADSLTGLHKVDGIAYRKGGGTCYQKGRIVDDLDSLPYPAYDLVNLRHYKEAPFPATRTPAATVVASRGCPHKCSFCLWPQLIYGGRVRFRKPGNVVDEIQYLKEKFGVQFVYFEDDYLNISWEKAEELCRAMIDKRIGISWGCLGRTEGVTRERLKLLKKAGLFLIKYGLETSSQALLSEIDKKSNIAQVNEAVQLTKKAGIMCHLTAMIGIPGETEKTLSENMRYIHKLSPDSIQFSLCIPFPGTSLYEECKVKGILEYNEWEDFDGVSGGVIKLDNFTREQLRSERSRAYMKYYSSLPFFLLRLKRTILGPDILAQLIRNIDLAKRLLHKVMCRS